MDVYVILLRQTFFFYKKSIHIESITYITLEVNFLKVVSRSRLHQNYLHVLLILTEMVTKEKSTSLIPYLLVPMCFPSPPLRYSRIPRTRALWKTLHEHLDTTLSFSTAYHPLSANRTIDQMLLPFVHSNSIEWDIVLP